MGPVKGLFVGFIVYCSAVLVAPLAIAAEQPTVTSVRIADHGGTTRFVMDVSDRVPFSVATTAPAEVTVTLPEIDWKPDNNVLAHAAGLIRKFAYSRTAGSRLVLETARPVKISKAFLIPPVDYPHYRLVLDLTETGTGAVAGEIRPPVPSAAAAMPPPPAVPPPAAAMPAPVPAALPVPGSVPVPGPRPAGRRGAAPAPVRVAKPVVAIDPGHGGADPGAISLTGAFEKNIVLALARDVKAQLDKGGKVKCVLTRDRDVFIALRDRVATARAAKADLFMSLHADTVADPEIHGLSVYTLSQTASDAEAQALADKENKADIVAGVDLSNESPEVTNILIDLVQRESMNLSAVFAGYVLQDVGRETQLLAQNTHRFAGFAVLKAPDIPSVLVETGYLSNTQDEQMLRRADYRARLAGAMARAIEHYFARNRAPAAR